MKKKNNDLSVELVWELEDFNDFEEKDSEADTKNPQINEILHVETNLNKDTAEEEPEDDTEDDSDEDSGDQGKSRKNKEDPKKKTSVLRELLSWVVTLGIAVGLALFVRNYVIINATVPTGSMENTIMPGDDLFGFRLAYQFSDPERGDIMIFWFPDDETQKYVKRVIGLPGEKVTITDGKVYINDSEVPLDEPYLKEEWVRATGPYEFEVPQGCYFMMGDNRNDSYDSRYWTNTFVSEDQIIGKALFTYFPFDRFGMLE